jgi:hypothetical protein
MKNNNKKIHGGLLRNNINNRDLTKNFLDFLENSKIKFLSKGSNSVIFYAKIKNKDIISPYVSLDIENKYKETRKIIIKLVFLKETLIPNVNNYLALNKSIINISNIESFLQEIEVQKDIFIKSIKYLQPYCPEILYTDIYDYENIDLILNHIRRRLKDQNILNLSVSILNQIKRLKKFNMFEKLGIIVMEYADGYHTLHKFSKLISIENYKYYNLYKNMALYLLIKLAIDTGYTQGDFHPGNIMINYQSINYFKDIFGSPLIIDFGLAKKIEENDLIEIKNYFAQKKYTEILKKLCIIGRLNNKNMLNNEYKKVYGWVYGSYNYYNGLNVLVNSNYDDIINRELDELNEKRKDAIKDIERISEEQYLVSKNNFFRLPLNNSIINRFYS